MAIHSLVRLSIVLTIVTLVKALPARLSRHVSQPRSPVSITQILQAGYGRSTYATYTGECIRIRNTNVPTKIDVDGNGLHHESLQLLGFSGDCSEDPVVTLPLKTSVLVNKRTPICSFMLNNRQVPTKPITVAFFGDRSAGSFVENITNERECLDLCSGTPTLEYAQTVEVHVNKQSTSNFITLFSDSNCESVIMSEVRNGTDLVQPTRHDSTIIRSFLIVDNRK